MSDELSLLCNQLLKSYSPEYESATEAIDDFKKFIPLAWEHIEPGEKYQHNWHIDAIAEHLSAVTNGQIRNLLINLPPRHAKSSIISVLWPAWEWLTNPSTKWLYSSYNQALSVRDNLKTRRLILSPWFQRNYSHLFKLAKDQKTKIRYDNDKGGYRIATSVGGGNTGEGGDRIVCLAYDTKIKLQMGQLQLGRICEEKIPHKVLSYSKKTRQLEYKRILQFFESESKEIVTIQIKDKSTKIEITPNHLVHTCNRSWVTSQEITAQDLLFDENKKEIRIESVKIESKVIKTYNLEIEDNNNYFANGILVHNCDDANNNKEAESQAILESTAIWWKETMSTRLNNPQLSTRTLVAQRTNEYDVSGVILSEMKNFEHLLLPAEYEGSKKVTSIGWSDPRKEMGELLWPERFTREVIDQLKVELGTYGFAAQLQQRPSPRGGGIIKRNWFQFYKLQRDVHGYIQQPRFTFILQSWDTAFKTGQENDYSVCLTIGVLHDGFYVISRYKDKIDLPELEKVSISLANYYSPNQIIIEDKASGQSLIQVLKKRTKLPIKAVQVDRDKRARLQSVSPLIEAGRFFLPENESWVNDYVDTICKFPTDRHDDDVDATTQALMHLSKTYHDKNNLAGSLLGR